MFLEWRILEYFILFLFCFITYENMNGLLGSLIFLDPKAFYMTIFFIDLEILLNILHYFLGKKNYSRKGFSTIIISIFFKKIYLNFPFFIVLCFSCEIFYFNWFAFNINSLGLTLLRKNKIIFFKFHNLKVFFILCANTSPLLFVIRINYFLLIIFLFF